MCRRRNKLRASSPAAAAAAVAGTADGQQGEPNPFWDKAGVDCRWHGRRENHRQRFLVPADDHTLTEDDGVSTDKGQTVLLVVLAVGWVALPRLQTEYGIQESQMLGGMELFARHHNTRLALTGGLAVLSDQLRD